MSKISSIPEQKRLTVARSISLSGTLPLRPRSDHSSSSSINEFLYYLLLCLPKALSVPVPFRTQIIGLSIRRFSESTTSFNACSHSYQEKGVVINTVHVDCIYQAAHLVPIYEASKRIS